MRTIRVKKKFSNCPKKYESRDRIIEAWMKVYNTSPLPYQYWSLCNEQRLEEGYEIYQMYKSGFITIDQFYGVDADDQGEKIIKGNKKSIPQANWYKNDFYDQIYKNYDDGIFKPSIINLDFNSMVDECVKYSSKVLRLLNSICKTSQCMVVSNMLLNNPHVNRSEVTKLENIITLFEQNKNFQKFWTSKKWSLYDNFITYNGTGKSNTIMGSIILWKK